jgi:solute carrier family 25 folate transporter 32
MTLFAREERSRSLPIAVLFGFSGAFGACTSGVLLYPLDTVRTRLQVQCEPSSARRYSGMFSAFRLMFREESLRSFYRGLPIHISALSTWAFIYFGTYNSLKHSLPAGPDHPFQQSVSAGCAWITSVFFTNPLWIVKTRAQLHNGPFSLYRAFTELQELRRRGTLMVGANAAMGGAVTVMIQLPLYERLKVFLHEHQVLQSGDGSLSPLGYFACSSLSMTVSSVLTYPQDVVRARLQGTDRYTGAMDCVRQTYRLEGLRGLYAGLGAHLARLLPTSAITFLVYERTCAWLSRP